MFGWNNIMKEQSYNPEAYDELMEFVERHSLNDADKFCADMMRESSRHQNLGISLYVFSLLMFFFHYYGISKYYS